MRLALPCRPLFLALALALAAPAALAAPDRQANEEAVQTSAGFLSGHPDLRWRLDGLEAYRAEDYEAAFSHFRRAARYADKPAQGMVAEMLWHGRGTAVDRPLAYAWMDLAAERNYPTMLLSRERYWKQMDEAERARALEIGKQVFAEYADEVAKPRLEAALRRGRKATGSRTGSGAGNLKIMLATPGGMVTVDSSQYYAARYWEADQYWSWQDTTWTAPARGKVDIGPLEAAPEIPSGADAEDGAEADPAG